MSLEELYNRSKGGLYPYAFRLAHESHEAEDLIQETFLRALEHHELLKILNPYQQQAWLRQTLKNLFLDKLSMRLREGAALAYLSLETDSALPPVEPGLIPEVLSLIPEIHREVFAMRYLAGMATKEIAKKLGIPAATVRSRLHLAIERLRSQKTKIS